MGDTPLLGNSYLRSRSSQYKCNIAHLRRTRHRQDDLVRRCKYFPSPKPETHQKSRMKPFIGWRLIKDSRLEMRCCWIRITLNEFSICPFSCKPKHTSHICKFRPNNCFVTCGTVIRNTFHTFFAPDFFVFLSVSLHLKPSPFTVESYFSLENWRSPLIQKIFPTAF